MAILVVEGPSAAGKTAWCQKHFAKGFVEAAPETIQAPDLFAEPRDVAAFWVEHNIRRWQRALEIEKWESIAVCDSDPLQLYFSWAFWKTGAGDSKLFELEVALYRKAIEEQRIGFADCVVWLEAPIEELRRRAKADATRKRKHLELYLEMTPWMHAWFAAREHVLPGCAREWTAAPRLKDIEGVPQNRRRYDVTVLDGLLAVCGGRKASS